MSAGLAVRTRIVRANGLSAGTHEIFNLVPSGRFVDGTATFANHSFALVLAGGRNRVVTRHDASGALLWRAELGDEEGAIAEPSIVPAVGDSLPGFYIASGFKALWRLDTNGSLQWEKDLFDHAGMDCQQTMAAHPSRGVVVGGVASRPTEAIEDCANCAIVRLAEDGTPLAFGRASKSKTSDQTISEEQIRHELVIGFDRHFRIAHPQSSKMSDCISLFGHRDLSRKYCSVMSLMKNP